RRMGVNDRLHVGALAVDPDMEAHAGIWPSAAEGLQILVDQHHAIGRRFVEAVAELQRPPRIWFLPARSHLPGEARLVALAREDAAGSRQRVARRQIGLRKVRGHLAAHAVDEVLLHLMRLGRNVEMIGNATRMARRTQSTSTNGITPRKMVRVGTCGSRVLSTKRFMPTGGLMRPISTTTTMRMPNHTGSR